MKLSVILTINEHTDHQASVQSILMQKEQDYELLILCEKPYVYDDDITPNHPHITFIVCDHEDSYCLENSGIYYAKGDYILFMRSGDIFVTSEAFSILLEKMQENPDILLFPYEQGCAPIETAQRIEMSNQQTIGSMYLQLFHKGIFHPNVSFYAYKRSLLCRYHLYFYTGIHVKDIYFTLQVCSYLHTYAYIETPLYQPQKQNEEKENRMHDILLLLDIFKNEQENMEYDMSQFVLKYLAHLYVYAILISNRKTADVQLWRQLDTYHEILHYHEHALLRKVSYFHKFYGYKGTLCILKIYNKWKGGLYGTGSNLYY